MESVTEVSLRNVPRSPALSATILESYNEAKKTFKQVKPTCGVESCLKNRRMRSIHQRARKANHTWKNEQRMAKRLRILKSREDAAQQWLLGETIQKIQLVMKKIVIWTWNK